MLLAGDISVSSDAAGSTVVAETSSLSDDFRYASITSFTYPSSPDPVEHGEIITFTGTGFATMFSDFAIPPAAGHFSVIFPGDGIGNAPNCQTGARDITNGTVATVKVPICAETGNITIRVWPNGDEIGNSDYEIYEFERPLTVSVVSISVNSFTPTEEAVGRMVEIMGTGFATAAGNNEVAFGNNNFSAQGGSITENNGVQTLTVRVPKSAVNGKIKVKIAGREDESMDDFTRINHTVASFAPTTFTGTIDEVTITGTNFSTRRADNEVCFDTRCVEASSVNEDGTELKAIPPEVSNQQTGTLKVNIGSVEVNAPGTFTLNPIEPLVFTDFSPKAPAEVRMGEEITITGSEFSLGVRIGVWTNTSIFANAHASAAYGINGDGTEMKFRIPPSVRGNETDLGAIVIRKCIRNCNEQGNQIYTDIGKEGLIITPTPPLTISGLSPNPVQEGSELTIEGTGFSLYAEHTIVQFPSMRFENSPSCHYVNGDGTELKVIVPLGARDGEIDIVHPFGTGGEVTSSDDLEITPLPDPVISDFMPTSGGPGREITINGSDFPLVAEYIEVCICILWTRTGVILKFVPAHWVNEDRHSA